MVKAIGTLSSGDHCLQLSFIELTIKHGLDRKASVHVEIRFKRYLHVLVMMTYRRFARIGERSSQCFYHLPIIKIH